MTYMCTREGVVMPRTSLTAEDIATNLGRAYRSGRGWCACCPAHDDHNPSLSITDREGGGVLVHCHAGCSQDTVIAALRERDLWPGGSVSHASSGNGTKSAVRKTPYPYHYQSGALACEAVRVDGPHGKGFYIRQPDNGKLQAPPPPYPLFRLPELISHPERPVLVVEGEKTALSAATLLPEYCVVTSLGGSKAAEKSDWNPLKDRQVVIWPDADEPGAKYAEDVAEQCRTVGAADVRIVSLPDELPKGWDLADTPPPDMDIRALVEAAQAPTVAGGLGLVTLGDLLNAPEEERDWLVDDMLQAGGFSMMASKPKAGKSTLARCLAIAIAQGRPRLGKNVTQGRVIYIALEEKRAEVSRHFDRMGAQENDPILSFIDQAPQDAFEQLECEVRERKPALVIIDPLFRFTRIADGNDYAQTTKALEPLLRLARNSGAHVLVTHHSKKSGGMDGDEALGSTALFGAVDCLISLKRFDDFRTAYTRQRYGTDMEEVVLALDGETGWVDVNGSRAEADERAMGEAILDFLGQTQSATEREITDKVEGRTKLIRTALRALVEAQKITRTGQGKKGDPYRYSCFRVPGIYQEQENEENSLFNHPQRNGDGG